jgi:hypothetical protein
MTVGGLVPTSDFNEGQFSAIEPSGVVDLVATLGSATADATVTVSALTIMSVAVDQQAVSLTAGGTQPLSVTATYSDGSTADVTMLAVWSSTDTTGAVVVVGQSPNARAVAVAEGTGTATLTAWVSPQGPYTGGSAEYSGTTTVTVQ